MTKLKKDNNETVKGYQNNNTAQLGGLSRDGNGAGQVGFRFTIPNPTRLVIALSIPTQTHGKFNGYHTKPTP